MFVTIVIPTYNRKKFENLISYNINTQNYPFIKEVIIADDGLPDQALDLKIKYNISYHTIPRCTIGTKRNYLNSMCTTQYIVCMDTDDFYSKNYISNSIYSLIKSGRNIAGSAEMIMYQISTGEYFYQRCLYLDMLNEATLVYTKKYADTHTFTNASSGEGISFLRGNTHEIIETDIRDVMCCITHAGNTVNKSAWLTSTYSMSIPPTCYDVHLNILSNINI